MNKKLMWTLIILGMLLAIMIAGGILNGSSSSDYEYAYYIESGGNIFVKASKVIEEATFYGVDIILSGIANLVGLFTS